MSAIIVWSGTSSTLWSVLQSAWSGSLPPIRTVWHDDQLPDLRRGRIEVQEAFVAHFWPQIVKESRRYGRVGGDLDDLQGEGALALWESVFGYCPTRHRTTFSDYVQNAVHGRVRRAYLRQLLHRDEGLDGRTLERAGAQDGDFAAAERALDIAQAVRTLSPKDRAALTWRPLPTMSRADYERNRKRRQRARRRLQMLLQQHP